MTNRQLVTLYLQFGGALERYTIPGLGHHQRFLDGCRAVTNIDIDPASMMLDYDVVETDGIHVSRQSAGVGRRTEL